ncbi:MAG: hypothetical protein QME12_01340 [Nanoarchaeota archaeon]|nr:hypothetical protein [Nanoarchaeota archaeon]
MDIKTASVRELYDDMSVKWEILSELFSKKDERGKPRLAVFSINYGSGGINVMNTPLRRLKFFAGFRSLPTRMGFEEKKDVFGAFLSDFSQAAYVPSYHLIAFNRQNMPEWQYPLAMPEEVMHSIVQVKDENVKVDAKSAASFSGFSAYFGHSICSSLKLVGMDCFNVDINEFFPPFAQSHFLGKGMEDYNWCLDEQVKSKAYFQPCKPKKERAADVSKKLIYISQIAGFMLAKQYKFDIRALLREHPSLPSLDGPGIWKAYCMPLLLRGKL